MNISEIIFVVLLVGGFLIPVAIAKRWYLFFTFLIFFACFGLMEWLSIARQDMSISQDFWRYSIDHPAHSWFILGGMLAGWIALLLHLGARNLFKSKKEKR